MNFCECWSHVPMIFLVLGSFKAGDPEYERECEGQTQTVPALRSPWIQGSRSQLKPYEWDLTLCSSKYVPVSFTADIKRQFCQAVSGPRKPIEHFSCISNVFIFFLCQSYLNQYDLLEDRWWEGKCANLTMELDELLEELHDDFWLHMLISSHLNVGDYTEIVPHDCLHVQWREINTFMGWIMSSQCRYQK